MGVTRPWYACSAHSTRQCRLHPGRSAQAQRCDGQCGIGGCRGWKDGGSYDEKIWVLVAAQVTVDHGAFQIGTHSGGADDVAGAFEVGAMRNLGGAEPAEDLR